MSQEEHLKRTKLKLDKPILEYCRRLFKSCDRTFYIGKLQQHCAETYISHAPQSVDRCLRSLRKEKRLDYKVIDKKMGLYLLLEVGSEHI